MSSGWIIFLAIVAGIGISSFVIYRKIKTKVEQVSMAAFGTRNFVEGYKRQADALAERSKSVSAMTRVFAPQIARDFPEFNLEQFRNKAENLLVCALQAVSAGNARLLKDASGELCQQVVNQIEGNRAAGVREVYRDIKVHQTEISNYQKKDGKCIITFQSAVEHFHYKEKDGGVIWGDAQRKQQTKYNTELVYIQDAARMGAGNAVGTTCPNCGAPITDLGNMRCEYCGAAVTPVDEKVWTLQQYYEVDYHRV